MKSRERTYEATEWRWSRGVVAMLLTAVLIVSTHVALADDLTGSDAFNLQGQSQQQQQSALAQQSTTEQIDNFKKAFSVRLEAKKFMVKFSTRSLNDE